MHLSLKLYMEHGHVCDSSPGPPWQEIGLYANVLSVSYDRSRGSPLCGHPQLKQVPLVVLDLGFQGFSSTLMPFDPLKRAYRKEAV